MKDIREEELRFLGNFFKAAKTLGSLEVVPCGRCGDAIIVRIHNDSRSPQYEGAVHYQGGKRYLLCSKCGRERTEGLVKTYRDVVRANRDKADEADEAESAAKEPAVQEEVPF